MFFCVKKFKNENMTTIKTLLELLAIYGGSIVSTASLKPEWIEQARASGRMYVDENSLGYVWQPVSKIPTNEQEVKDFEKWFPLDMEMPQELKNIDTRI